MENRLELSESKKAVARLLTKQFKETRGFLLNKYGLDYRSLISQVDYWVSTNVEEGEKYNKYFLYQFTLWLEKGFIGDPNVKKTSSIVLESSMKRDDGRPAENALSLVEEAEDRGEERLDFVTLLSRLSERELKSIPCPDFFYRLKLNWKTFFKTFDDCSFTIANIRERLDIKEHELKRIARSINYDLAPALRNFFPEYVAGEAQKVSFKSEERIGKEEDILKKFVYQLSKPKNRILTKKTLYAYVLGGSEAKNMGKEKLELYDRAVELGLSSGVLRKETTKTGLEGFTLVKEQ